jgi:flagellar biosynthesis protein FliQ
VLVVPLLVWSLQACQKQKQLQLQHLPKPIVVQKYILLNIENLITVIDSYYKNLKDIKIKTNITKDGWSANVVDKKDKIQIKIGEVK